LICGHFRGILSPAPKGDAPFAAHEHDVVNVETTLALIVGAVAGALVALVIGLLYARQARVLAGQLLADNNEQRAREVQILLDRVKDAFGTLSLDALSRNSNEFLRLANESLSRQTLAGERELEGKKALIDVSLLQIEKDLLGVQNLVTDLEKDREQKFGEVTHQLRRTADETERLRDTTEHLRRALASRDVRGQWGQRMAEDVLRLAGFVEGINYVKQRAMPGGTTIPDFTFLLPQDLRLNMDVKFPLDNYMQYVEAEAEADRQQAKRRFLADVRERIKEVTGRGYINPAERTIDYALVFIPNEQIYAFINDNDRTVMDDALRQKIILCSPLTLYAILAVIRQAVDNFNLEHTAAQILALLGNFAKQWEMFVAGLEKMGKRIEDAQAEYQQLTSTRRRGLERPLREIEELRQQRGILPSPDTESGTKDDTTIS
jgi:DNA recombination protein RmuC